jgi:hypothetical protein
MSGGSSIADHGYLETTFNVSQIVSQKNGLRRSAARMNVLVGGGGVAMSEQIADTEKVP